MIWIAGICVICLGVCLPLYMYYKGKLRFPMACSYKSLGTLCAFLPALVAAIRLDPHCWFCAAALLLYAVADTVLEYRFEAGMGVFLAGHILLIAFFLHLAPISAYHFIGLLVLGALSAYALWRSRKQLEKRLPAFILYGVGLIIMCVSAIACFSAVSLAGILIAAGGALFFISDFILFHVVLYPASKPMHWTVMITYYAALLCFGIACLQM